MFVSSLRNTADERKVRRTHDRIQMEHLCTMNEEKTKAEH